MWVFRNQRSKYIDWFQYYRRYSLKIVKFSHGVNTEHIDTSLVHSWVYDYAEPSIFSSLINFPYSKEIVCENS